jgi:hypothetical protein
MTGWRTRFEQREAGYVTPCLVWTGATTNGGYGVTKIGGQQHYVHRLVWTQAFGPPPHQVCHHCDNPPCARLDHLFAGTAAANSADMVAKHRQALGERNRHAKLTPDEVIAIRSLAGRLSQLNIAALYGVSEPTVNHIIKRRTWRHLP